MQLIIKNGKIIATHTDNQVVAHLYPDTECILWDKQLPPFDIDNPSQDDPRSAEEKKVYYLDKRRVAYPAIQDQLDMIYHDKINATNTWVDTITSIKEEYPKLNKVDNEICER